MVRIIAGFIIAILGLWLPQVWGMQNPSSEEERKIKDSAGREWSLLDWQENSRPYAKDLKEREARYRKKWGENWYGPMNGRRIHNPGNWQWEVVATVSPNLAKKIASKRLHSGKPRVWGDRFWGDVFIWAPGGSSTVTDVYALADRGIYLYDPVTRLDAFIGNPDEGGSIDGVAENARLQPGWAVTLDSVTGRLYFIQDNVWRYVEKLLPYECTATGKTCYLPAVLDWDELYKKTKSPFGGELRPVMRDGKRAGPVYVVRTNTALRIRIQNLPGARIGKRPLVAPDGKGIYFSEVQPYGREWDTLTLYDHTALFDINTGVKIENLKVLGDVPKNYRAGSDGPGSHGGNCMGYDGRIYTSQHGGAGGGPGRMFSIDPSTGEITILYSSMEEGKPWHKRKNPLIDGPADAESLDFTSTLWQVQCPRTGAIVNGGWDNSGIRRYHDGFVTSIVNGDEQWKAPPRPGWVNPPSFHYGNSNPSIAPNGDLYIADVNFDVPRIIRIYRTDWPKEQPVNGYAEKFLPKEKMEALILGYANKYIANYERNDELVKDEK